MALTIAVLVVVVLVTVALARVVMARARQGGPPDGPTRRESPPEEEPRPEVDSERLANRAR